jgi:hypothetical protein
MTLRTVCAWCLVILDTGDAPTPVSHGLCDECAEKLEASIA